MLILQTPASMRIDDRNIRSLRDFFSSLKRRELDMGWEVRSRLDSSSTRALSELMFENGITHVTDLSVSLPIVHSSVVYTRLFGRGVADAPVNRFTE